MKAKQLVVILAVVGVGMALVFFGGRTSRSETAVSTGESPAGESLLPSDGTASPDSRRRVASPKKTAKPVLNLTDDDEDDEETKRTPEEKKLAADIEKALDDEDFELAKRCASLAVDSKVPEIRQAMVDTLGWFGRKALPELTPYLADLDGDIAESAFDEWSMALSEIEDDGEKVATVELAMKVLTDADQLDDISSEYIGVDEKLAVESLLRIIEGGGSPAGIDKAKETYEFVTGDEFTNRAAAEKWIAEEYEPPTETE